MTYLDHNATTPLHSHVRAAMAELMADPEAQGNPSSIHRAGQRARAIVESARRKVAAAVAAEALEVTFTSGGTESANLALFGAARAARAAGRPDGLLSTPLEHPCVLQSGERLQAQGHQRVLLAPDGRGRIAEAAISAALSENPEIGVVSIAAANHELGNVYDIPAMVRAARAVRPDIVFHSDAVQAFGKVAIDFSSWDVDYLGLSAHKVGGPKGVGALVHRKHVRLEPGLVGGHQERGRRPGTENLLGVHGFGIAAELIERERESRREHCVRLRDALLAGLESIAGAEPLGDPAANVGSTVLCAFDGCEGELLLMNLDLAGYCVSTGSACTAGTLEPSRVVLALGATEDKARSTLRISVGPSNTMAEIDGFLSALVPTVERVRASSNSVEVTA